MSATWRILRNEGLTKERPQTASSLFDLNLLNKYYAATSQAHPPCPLNLIQDLRLQPYQANEKLALPILSSHLTMARPSPPRCSFAQLSATEISILFRDAIKKSKGRSPDNLPICHFLPYFLEILPHNTSLFNLIISTSKYPDTWERALLLPLNKISSPVTPSDTRPIAGLCHLAKVSDKALTEQIKHYLESNNLITPYQSGFRSNHSTQTAFLYLTDNIRLWIEEGLLTLLLCFDIRKAFDSFSHEALMEALFRLNFSESAMTPIHSYLSERSQAVVNENGEQSDYKVVTSGVPQGFSPGPIIFLILANSLPSFLMHCLHTFSLFADDLQIFIRFHPSDYLNAFSNMNDEIDRVTKWASSLGLSLNSAKTKAMVLGNGQTIRQLDASALPPLWVDGQQIELVSSHKILGVTLSSDLTWNAHIASVSSKVNGVIYKLKRKSSMLSTNLRLNLFRALALPHLDYCSLVYYDLPDYLNLKLQRLMNTAIRFIFKLRQDEELNGYYEKVGWHSVELRRQYLLGCLTFKILNSAKPHYLSSGLHSLSSDLRRSMRIGPPLFSVPTCRTNAYKHSFLVSACELWLRLPSKLREHKAFTDFKSGMLRYINQLDSS